MLGLVVLLLLLAYVALVIWATKRGWRWGVEQKGWTGRKRYRGAALGFLLVTLPVFWDWLPTVAMHQYYCATESGFWVYKTLDQWKAENPGVMETLVANKFTSPTSQGTKGNSMVTYHLNQRVNRTEKESRIFSVLPVWRLELAVVDSNNDEILARYVDFWTGYKEEGWDFVKTWMTWNKHCRSYQLSKFNTLKKTFSGRSK